MSDDALLLLYVNHLIVLSNCSNTGYTSQSTKTEGQQVYQYSLKKSAFQQF